VEQNFEMEFRNKNFLVWKGPKSYNMMKSLPSFISWWIQELSADFLIDVSQCRDTGEHPVWKCLPTFLSDSSGLNVDYFWRKDWQLIWL